MRRAVCPGSFDPVTLGHLDVISRAAVLVDELIVAVGANMSKTALFTPEERLSLLVEACAEIPGVRVRLFDGLLVDFCRAVGADTIIKGVRSAGDFGYELPMAQMNQHLSGVQTVFVPCSPPFAYVSSSLVREVARLGGDVAAFLTPAVQAAVVDKVSPNGTETRGRS